MHGEPYIKTRWMHSGMSNYQVLSNLFELTLMEQQEVKAQTVFTGNVA